MKIKRSMYVGGVILILVVLYALIVSRGHSSNSSINIINQTDSTFKRIEIIFSGKMTSFPDVKPGEQCRNTLYSRRGGIFSIRTVYYNNRINYYYDIGYLYEGEIADIYIVLTDTSVEFSKEY